MEAQPAYKELDARRNDGHTVQLLWDPESGETAIRVEEDDPHSFRFLARRHLRRFNIRTLTCQNSLTHNTISTHPFGAFLL